MRKIVDRNFLQSPELREYLLASKKNFVVVTDYAAMESFKGDSLANISSAFSGLFEFPERVIVLKNTHSISTLKGRRCGFTRRMIDRELTRGFPEWCSGLTRAMAGDENLRKQIIEKGALADTHLAKTASDQETYAENLEVHARKYDEQELKALRSKKPLTTESFIKVQKHVLELTAHLFLSDPNITELPPAIELPYTFNFRYAAAGYLLALRWISVGGAKGVKKEKIRNDIVDSTYAAYATYFQGFLTHDANAIELYQETKYLIELFLSNPPPPAHLGEANR